MPKAAPLQNNFNAGEFSPLASGRVDSDRYRAGLATCLNYVPLIQGGLQNRSGTKFVGLSLDQSNVPGVMRRLLQRFEFSSDEAYVLEFTNQNLQFYKNNAPILLSGKAITNVTQANPGVVTLGSNYTNASGVGFITGVGGMTQLNSRFVTYATTAAAVANLSFSTAAYSAYTSGGSFQEQYKTSVPYEDDDLPTLRFVQSADVLYMLHKNHAPRKLTRISDTNWAVTTIDFRDGPYLPINTTSTTITPSATSGSGITLTASAATFVVGGPDVGRLVRLRHSSTWGYAKITSVSSTTVAVADVVSNFGATTATAFWRLGAWSPGTGFPSCGTFFEDRLILGGATSTPQRFDGSKTSDYENFAATAADGTVAADNAVAYTLSSDDVQNILWLASDEKGLLAGTTSGEWVIRTDDTTQPLSALNPPNAKQSSWWGSAAVAPIRAGKSTIFVQRSKKRVHEMGFFLEADGFASPDLTEIAEHIAVGGIKQLAYMKVPQSIVWVVRDDGILLGMTFRRDQEGRLHAAWHRHKVGGVSDAIGTHAKVDSIAVIPSPDQSRDELWMVVNRYIGGANVRYIEYMTKFFDEGDDKEDAFFVDGGIDYSGASATTITGLWHLEGQTVKVLSAGNLLADEVVTNGQIVIDNASTRVIAGLGYNADGQQLRQEAGAADGTALGKTRRIHRVGFLMHRSLNLQIGTSFTDMQRALFGGDAVPMPLFSGVVSETIDTNYDFDNQICWRQDYPLPSIILAVMPQMVTQDR